MAHIRRLRSVSSVLVAGLLLMSCSSARVDPREFDEYYSNADAEGVGDDVGMAPARYQPDTMPRNDENLAPRNDGVLTPRGGGDNLPILEADAGRVVRLQKGESLYGLAQRHLGSGKRWREIAQLNGLSEAEVTRIPVGKEIKLPAR